MRIGGCGGLTTPPPSRAIPSLCLYGFTFFLPVTARGFTDQALFNHAGGDPDMLHLTVGQLNLDALKIWAKPPFGDCRYVGTDTTLFLGLTGAPNDASAGGPLT